MPKIITYTMHTCPMIAFNKALKGDYSEMKKGLFATKKAQYRAFVCVFDEADKVFNLSNDYRQYLALRVQASQMYAKAVQGQKHYYTRAKIKELEADAVMNRLSGGDKVVFEQSCAMLSKKMQFPVKPKEITVSEYYSYIAIK